MRFLLIGNYGVGNLGDEALKEYFLKTYPEIDWVVVSANPRVGEYPRLPFGFRSFFSTQWIGTIGAMRRSDGVVFGGGSLFTDTESTFACFLWGIHALVPILMRKRIYIAFQGVGPLQGRWGAKFCRWVMRHASYISVRDEASEVLLQSWSMNKKVVQSFDPVFSLISDKNTLNSTNKVFIVIPRNNSSQLLENRALELLKYGWDDVRVLSLQPDDRREVEFCEKLKKSLGGSVIAIRSLEELTSECSAASFILSQRYHGALTALALNIPYQVIPQGVDDKLTQLDPERRKFSKEELLRLVNVGEEELRAAFGDK